MLVIETTKMKNVFLIFPHQLFRDISNIESNSKIYLIEEVLFFHQYKFHKQKLVFQRASMQAYKKYLQEKNFEVEYVESTDTLSDIRILLSELLKNGVREMSYYDVCDQWLEKRISNSIKNQDVKIKVFESKLFINSRAEIKAYFRDKKKFSQTHFYIAQRKKNNLLTDTQNRPLNGKWTFDVENRSKYPKAKIPPKLLKVELNEFYKEAINYVETNFASNYGVIDTNYIYPVTYKESEAWIEDFFKNRFADFGLYEDAIVQSEVVLNHSLLSLILNVGLIEPMEIINQAIKHYKQGTIPFNSLEGFIRQILGWREFIRAVYILRGGYQRKRNFWDFKRQIPKSFYIGQTNILPIDTTIKKLLKTGYNHHIERLMILSSFMLLCEFNPDKVYKWFMEMYIDAYDWVMVPNTYGMGQFADGGLMSTKPYISGSNYIVKMSDYKKDGSWGNIWDSLFWRFIDKHRDFLSQNPRLNMMVQMYDKFDILKKAELNKIADHFLSTLYKN